jgi:peptidoglycan/xylan/chitin deacetylase (PgdA/CDA1 family)
MFDSGEAARKIILHAARLSGASALLRNRLQGIGAILMVHRVTVAPAKPLGINRHLNVAPAFLDASIAEMKRMGYRFVSMDEAIDRLSSRSRELFATVTADDAYRDNLTEALPVLEKHEAPATIYVCPGLTGRAIDLWWDVLEDIVTAREEVYLTTPAGREVLDCRTPRAKVEANRRILYYLISDIPEEQRQTVLRDIAAMAGVDPQAPSRDTLMDWDEVRRAAAHPLLTIGSHTVSHYLLRRLGSTAAWNEMVDAARIIEVETGIKPRHFAYPYGKPVAVGEREVELAASAGFASAVTTRHGVLQPDHAGHLMALPRISINGRYQKVAHLRTMLSGVTTALSNSGRGLVTV